MSIKNPDNAITQRLGILTALYQEFFDNDEAKICYWFLEADEYSMIEQFIDIETSINASFPDLIIQFLSVFEDKNTFGQQLVGELAELVNWYKEELGDDGEPINWTPLSMEDNSGPDVFIQNLSAFGNGLEDLDDPVVAFIAPTYMEDYKQMEQWLLKAIQSPVPSNVRFMVVDFIDNQIFPNLANDPTGKVMIIKPELDMKQAMKELALAGGSTHPGTQFQVIYTDLSHAATKGQMDKVERYAEKALEIVVAEGWYHLQVAVHTTVGTAWGNVKENEKALAAYEKAIKAAQLAIKHEDPVGAKLLANALFAKAAMLINMKAFEEANEVYESIVTITKEAEEHYLTMEAWRMAGFCLERSKQPEQAYTRYENAIETATLLEKEVLEDSTLPYTGEAMLKINDDCFNDRQKQTWIEERLSALLGDNWKS